MKLTLLGTGNALVTECYNTCFALTDGGEHFIVDGGGGSTVLTQLKHAGIELKNVHTIFVTHKHIDHILGVLWLIRIICQNINGGKYDGDAVIYGHGEVIGLLREMSDKLLQKKETKLIGNRVHLVEVADGEEKTVLGRKTTFFDIHSAKAKQFGFCMELENGEKLTCCGDEPYDPCEKSYAENSKWMLHEAFCLYSERDIFSPYEKHHSTVKDACELAEKLNVKNLVLYHTEDKNILNRKHLYTAEGEKYYHGKLFVPYDLESIEL